MIINQEHNEQFIANLRYLRTQKGLSQAQLSKELGFTQTWVSSLESGKRNASKRTVEAVSIYFGIPAQVLLESDIKTTPRKKYKIKPEPKEPEPRERIELNGYQKKLIRVAIQARIRQEAHVLACGMEISDEQVMEVFEEGRR